jgi:Flp pilus assembly protein TadG
MTKARTFRRKIALVVSRTQRHAADQRGSAILETALSLLVFLSFLFGIMQAGFALYTYNYLCEASREGARYAIVRGATWGSPCASYTSSDCTASPTQIQSYVQSLGYAGITVSTPVYTAFAKGSSCPATPPCNTWGNQVAITVTYNFPLNVPFIPPHTAAMSSTSAMIIAQ